MNKEKAHEIMSKVLTLWDERHGLENCSQDTISELFKTLLLSPHDDGLMRISLVKDLNKTHLVPFEDIILFGLKGVDVDGYKES